MKSLFDIGDDECRFPIGSKKPFKFCGASVTSGCSYCEKHAKVVYRNPDARPWERPKGEFSQSAPPAPVYSNETRAARFKGP